MDSIFIRISQKIHQFESSDNGHEKIVPIQTLLEKNYLLLTICFLCVCLAV